MIRVCIAAILCCAATPAQTVGACGTEAPEITEAFDQLYNFNFNGAHHILDRYISAHPSEPLPYAIRASAYLFYELDRLGILESEFLISDKRIVDKRLLKPDPAVRAKFMQALEDAQSRAETALAAHPDDRQALLAMCIVEGVTTDYMALVEKHQIASLAPARRSNGYAQQLLKMKPPCYDAYMTAGLSEYMLGSLPFFIRWFVRFDNVQGSREQGVRNLQLVARDGHCFKAFAKILLGIIYLREKKPHAAARMLAELAHDYPSNPLFRSELARLNTQAGAANDASN
jgi:hypothetical protein